jgi:amino acid transporter
LSSNKTAQKFGWVLEIIPFVLTALFGAGLFIIAIINSTLDNYIVISLLLTCVVILMVMAIFMRLSAVYRRKA